MTQKCDFCSDTGWISKIFDEFPCPDCEDSGDPTRIALAYNPESRRMKGVTAHGNMPFDVPFLTQIEGNLWQGGTTEGLVLPEHIKHFVTLYPWEKYTVNHELDSYLEFRMYDSLDQSMAQVDEIAAWVVNRMADGVTSVTCQAGLNRSSLIVARALMMVGLTSVEAIALIREKRSPACFSNQEFERYLKSLDGSGYSVS